MTMKYLDVMMTDSVCRAQKHYYGHTARIADAPGRDSLGEAEVQFIAVRESFYLSTVSETGWPYIQHRGGPQGFLRVVNKTTLAFADYKGNRQLLTTGNISANDRAALLLMDYTNRERLKIFGHTRVEDARVHPELVAQLADPTMRSAVERLVFIDIVAFDWNCPKYITPRYSAEEVEELVGPLKARVTELEAALYAARSLGHASMQMRVN